MTSIAQSPPARLAGWIGRISIQFLLHWVDLLSFTVRALSVWRKERNINNRVTRASLVNQIIFTGVDAVPVFTFLALTIGMGITTQLIYLMQTVGNTQEVAYLLSRVVATELGPLLTAIILIGRSGSAITVDLGNTNINGELAALEMLGVDVNDVFVVPRIVSTTLSQMLLAVYFTFIALVSGIALSGYLFDIPFLTYLSALVSALGPADLLAFLLKNMLFGIAIGATACFHALLIRGSITEVPQHTQRAIMQSITLVFLLDVFTLLMLL